MAKRVPKHIKAKVERANRLMEQITALNMEIEEWMEKSGVTDDGFDYTYDFRDSRGYGYFTPEWFFERIDGDLNN
jgi:flagellar hook-associated protein FlgK